MKRRLLLIVLALTTAVSASAQWFDFSSNERLDVGFNIGRVAHNTPYARMGYGVFVNAWERPPDWLRLRSAGVTE